jgi:hypothetical protein
LNGAILASYTALALAALMAAYLFWFDGHFKRPRPSQSQLVHALVAGTAGLELAKGDARKLPPLAGVYGSFIIAGNSLPEISYQVFDDALMEFVHVTVYAALPDHLTFECRTDDLGPVVTKPEYERPFRDLLMHLYAYFPLMAEPKEVRNVSV